MVAPNKNSKTNTPKESTLGKKNIVLLVVLCVSLITLLEIGVRRYLLYQISLQNGFTFQATVEEKTMFHFLKLKYSYWKRQDNVLSTRSEYIRVTPEFYKKIKVDQKFQIQHHRYFAKVLNFEGRWLFSIEFIFVLAGICLSCLFLLFPLLSNSISPKK